MSVVDEAVGAIREGEVVVLPTDTVYGLCASAADAGAVARLGMLKRRPAGMPLALLAADLESLFAALPELSRRERAIATAILPGPYTVVVANPAQRFRPLVPDNPHTIGVRVPELPDAAKAVLGEAGPVAATSANRHGERDPARLEDVPAEILAACGAALDGGTLPGTPSTVLDLTGPQPRVLREGAVPAAEALETIARVATE